MVKKSKSSLKRQRNDLMRPLRVVKYLDYPFVIENSPVQINEGYIVSDRETCDVFASFIFKNISENPIEALDIRMEFYYNQNIPNRYVDFTYSCDNLNFGIIAKNGKDLKLKEANKRKFVYTSETFGSCVYIPISDKHYKKMNIVIKAIKYAGREREEQRIVVAGKSSRFSDLDNVSKLVYSRINIYSSAEYMYPTTVVPQFSEKAWLCCCGNKNPYSAEKCERCGREKEWQKKSVSAVALEETKKHMVSDPTEVTLHDKSNFKQNKYLENHSDIDKKIKQYEEAMRNVAIAERGKERRQMLLIPKIIGALAVIAIVCYILQFLIELQNIEDDNSNMEGIHIEENING